jgi:nitrite reductase/ring-hydroxylating ferredoxin subunit
VRPGAGLYVPHDDWDLAVLRPSDDEVFVLHNRCPHAGGSLASGWTEDGCVVCPWHAWSFDLTSGECPEAPQFRAQTFPARVCTGRVEAQLGRPRSSDRPS